MKKIDKSHELLQLFNINGGIMSSVTDIFQQMASRYQTNQVAKETIYYFKIGNEKFTLFASPDKCEVKEGKVSDEAHCVIVSDPKLFSNLVLKGKKPNAMDLMRGKLKASDMGLLLKLQDLFGLKLG